MKKYWKIVILPLFIVLTFGILYVHHAIAKEGLPQFELVNVSDDEGIGEDIIVYGDYVTNNNPVWESFRLSSDGIMYSSERNFLEQFNAFFQTQELEQLLKEERSFMRGKEEVPHLYVEEGERVAYVGPSNPHMESFEFEVDVLDRDSRDRKSFKLDIPDREKIDHLYVEKVQHLDDTLYVTTINYFLEGNELHVYEISLDDERITHHGAIAEGSIHSLNLLNYQGETEQQEYLILREDYTEWNESMHAEEVINQEYFAYDVKTGKKQLIEAPEEFDAEPDYPNGDVTEYLTNHISIGNEELYFITFTSEGLSYYPYRLRKNELHEKKEISFDENILSGLSGVSPKGDHLYFYSKVEENGNQVKKLFKVDLVNGEIVYEGEIKLTDTPKETHVYNVEVFNVEEKR